MVPSISSLVLHLQSSECVMTCFIGVTGKKELEDEGRPRL